MGIQSPPPNLHTLFPTFSPSLIRPMVAVDVKHHVYLLTNLSSRFRSCVKVEVAVLGSPSLTVLNNMVSVDVQQHQKKEKKKYELSVTNVLPFEHQRKTVNRQIFSLCWPICLEQFASNTPPLLFCLLF